MGDAKAVSDLSGRFIDQIYTYTEYENRDDGERTFNAIRASAPQTCQSPDGKKLVQKFLMLGRTVSTEGTFKDMVKIIWRMVKPMSGTPVTKIGLFVLSISAVAVSLRSRPNAGSVEDAWLEDIAKWLGKQMTIGGKGCTGEGEGSATDRIQRFFSTPYLHDFD